MPEQKLLTWDRPVLPPFEGIAARMEDGDGPIWGRPVVWDLISLWFAMKKAGLR